MTSARKPKAPKTRQPEIEPTGPTRPGARDREPKGRERRRPGRSRPEGKGPALQEPAISRSLLPGPWQANAIAFLLCVVATLALYAGDRRLGFFIVDDQFYAVDNPWIRSFSGANLRHVLGTPYFANYSPLHLLSYALDYALAGANPYAFHLSSNSWAGVVAGFVFLVALALTGRRPVALAAAVLFVVHPAHVEAIAWISSRKDLVAAAFALPSLLAYLRYRRGGRATGWWYAASLLLFLLAVAGKLSVATFPAVFLAVDLFVEGRPLRRSLPDKVPFLVAAACVALAAAGAQPATGQHSDPNVLAAAFLQNLGLLTGFGSYVIYRLSPDPAAGMEFQPGAAMFLLAAFAAPLLLYRRYPRAAVLAYWILFALIPAQALSLAHPVADRYLFFPSVAAVILLAWGGIAAGERWGRRGLAGVVLLLAVIGFLWGRATLAYLAEWRDPRSVFYAATRKSSDPELYLNLGLNYRSMANGLGMTPGVPRIPRSEARRLAAVVWAGDERLPTLLADWSRGQHDGPVEKSFQDRLRGLAWDAFEGALRRKGTRLMPDLYFQRGWVLIERGDDLGRARKEFQAAVEDASRHQFTQRREEMTIKTHSALGVVALQEGNYREALRWFRMAEGEQARFGGNWVPEVVGNRRVVEAMLARSPGRYAGPPPSPDTLATADRYLDAADRLGATPQGAPLPQTEARQLASAVWARDRRLPALLAEWSGGRRGGPVEKMFQDRLRTLAWDVYERAVLTKGPRLIPYTYFRRGRILVDRGDLRGARQQFLAAVDEASRFPVPAVREEATVESHNALGSVAWRAGDHREALRWLQMAEEEQTRFGGKWVPNLTADRQRLESVVAKLPAR